MILRRSNGEPVHDDPPVFSLNTSISILATVARAALLFATASLLGQSKWNWFRSKPRKVYDMQSFDNASRGPLGSLLMVLNLDLISIAFLGAFVTILAPAIDPAIQQSVDLIQRSEVQKVLDGRFPTLKRATTFNISRAGEGDAKQDHLKAATYQGLWARTPALDRSAQCSSGECTWEPFYSLEWCAKCQDYNLPFECSVGLWQNQSCPLKLYEKDHGAGVQIEARGNNTIAFTKQLIWESNVGNGNEKDAPYAYGYANTTHQYNADSNTFSVLLDSAKHCSIHVCITKNNVTVHGGQLNSTVMETDTGRTYVANDSTCWSPNKAYSDFHITFTHSRLADTVIGPPTDGERPGSICGFDPIGSRFPIFPQHDVQVITMSAGIFQETAREAPPGSGGEGTLYHRMLHDYVSLIGIEPVFHGMAVGLSQYTQDVDNADSTVNGEVRALVTVVQVRWLWLALPIGVNVLASLYLVWVVLETYRHDVGIWKTSLLPLLYRPLDRRQSLGAANVEEMEVVAKGEAAQLESTAGGGSSGRLMNGAAEGFKLRVVDPSR